MPNAMLTTPSADSRFCLLSMPNVIFAEFWNCMEFHVDRLNNVQDCTHYIRGGFPFVPAGVVLVTSAGIVSGHHCGRGTFWYLTQLLQEFLDWR